MDPALDELPRSLRSFQARQPFADVLANPGHLAAAARAQRALGLDDLLHPRPHADRRAPSAWALGWLRARRARQPTRFELFNQRTLPI